MLSPTIASYNCPWRRLERRVHRCQRPKYRRVAVALLWAVGTEIAAGHGDRWNERNTVIISVRTSTRIHGRERYSRGTGAVEPINWIHRPRRRMSRRMQLNTPGAIYRNSFMVAPRNPAHGRTPRAHAWVSVSTFIWCGARNPCCPQPQGAAADICRMQVIHRQGKCQLLHPATPYYPFPRGKFHTRGNIWSFTVG